MMREFQPMTPAEREVPAVEFARIREVVVPAFGPMARAFNRVAQDVVRVSRSLPQQSDYALVPPPAEETDERGVRQPRAVR